MDYHDKNPLLIGVLTGVYVTMADLGRQLTFEHDVDFIKASSYGTDISAAACKITMEPKLDVCGRHVILIDEMVDSGKTFACTAAKLTEMGAASVRTLCIVDKVTAHLVDIEVDYCVLRWEGDSNQWIFGYGLDCKERLRSSRYIGVVTDDFKKHEPAPPVYNPVQHGPMTQHGFPLATAIGDLHALHVSGALTAQEFTDAKARLISDWR